MSSMVRFLEERGITVRYAKGGYQPCKCPYHEDRTASATVNSTTDRFHCFVCGINEDVIGLIRYENPGVTYVEAKQKAEEEYGQGVKPMDGVSGSGSSLLGVPWNRSGRGGTLPSWRSSLR